MPTDIYVCPGRMVHRMQQLLLCVVACDVVCALLCRGPTQRVGGMYVTMCPYVFRYSMSHLRSSSSSDAIHFITGTLTWSQRDLWTDELILRRAPRSGTWSGRHQHLFDRRVIRREKSHAGSVANESAIAHEGAVRKDL